MVTARAPFGGRIQRSLKPIDAHGAEELATDAQQRDLCHRAPAPFLGFVTVGSVWTEPGKHSSTAERHSIYGELSLTKNSTA
jgi:hypothetical protein